MAQTRCPSFIWERKNENRHGISALVSAKAMGEDATVLSRAAGGVVHYEFLPLESYQPKVAARICVEASEKLIR